MKTRAFAVAACLSLAAAGVSAWTLADRVPPPGAINARPVHLKDLRIANLQPSDSQSQSMFDKPGLVVTLELALPKGKRLIEVEQPTQIAATDSVGTDLTTIPAGFGGDRDFWEMGFGSDLAQGRVKLALASPRRDAATFSVGATATAAVFSGTEQVTLARTGEWTKLDPAKFGVSGQYRVGTSRGELSVEFKPQTVRDAIESLAFVEGEATFDSNGCMWGMGSATYSFSSDAPASARLVATVRVGLEKLPVRIEIKDQPLP